MSFLNNKTMIHSVCLIIALCMLTLNYNDIHAEQSKDKINKVEKNEKDKPVKKGQKKMAEAPEKFFVEFETTKGKIKFESVRSWSPHGVDRFYELVNDGFFKDIGFFRVAKNFVVQFGIHGDPAVSAVWRNKNIADDPVKESNKKGYLSFATAGPGTRTTQLFINLKDNSGLDGMGFSPIAKVVDGMDIVENINSQYGERPEQHLIQSQGNSFLKEQYPGLDYILSAKIVK